MNRGLHAWRQFLLLALSLTVLSTSDALDSASHEKMPAVRWAEQSPGCTISRGDDGKYRYGLWAENVGIVMAVDSDELEKVHHRHQHFFAILLTIRYRGHDSLDVGTGNISLEFVSHFHVTKTALDPDAFAQKIQADADALNDQTARWVKKHPDHKEQRESFVRAYLKDSAELQEFVGKNSLRATELNSGHPEVSGWVLFSTDNKWIGGWKKQEEFIVRVPLEGKMYEFPFKLPPKPGEVLLRKRQ
jgi:hypothetical protein